MISRYHDISSIKITCLFLVLCCVLLCFDVCTKGRLICFCEEQAPSIQARQKFKNVDCIKIHVKFDILYIDDDSRNNNKTIVINSKDLKPMSRLLEVARKGTWVKSDLTSLSRFQSLDSRKIDDEIISRLFKLDLGKLFLEE